MGIAQPGREPDSPLPILDGPPDAETVAPDVTDPVSAPNVDRPPQDEALHRDAGELAVPDGCEPETAAATSSIAPVVADSDRASVPAPQQTETPGTCTPRNIDLEHCLLAFGNALQASHERNGRDVLHIVLTAQQEHLAMLMQALADQRLDYGEQLERAVKRLSDELNPESILQIGELFRTSAGQITGALARTERLSANMIEKQNRILDGLGTLADQLAKLLTVITELRDLGHSLTGLPVPMSPQRAPPARETERRLSLVAGHPDVLADIRDDLDDDDDT